MINEHLGVEFEWHCDGKQKKVSAREMIIWQVFSQTETPTGWLYARARWRLRLLVYTETNNDKKKVLQSWRMITSSCRTKSNLNSIFKNLPTHTPNKLNLVVRRRINLIALKNWLKFIIWDISSREPKVLDYAI